MSEPQVKGIAFKGILAALERLHGKPTLEAVKHELPPGVARLIEYRAIVTGNWYPLSQYALMFEAVKKVLKRGPDVARELSREATLDDFRGIYRILTFVLSPEFLMKRAPGIWSRYYDSGRIEVLDARDGYAIAKWSDCRGFNRTLWEDAFGGAQAILEACGARDVRWTVLAGGDDGDERAEIMAHWS